MLDPLNPATSGGDLGVGIIAAYSISAAVAVYALIWAYGLLTDPLRDIPGPLAARFTTLWLAREYSSGNHHVTDVELHRRYGPIVRIAPGRYSIDDPAAVKILYGLGSALKKSYWYRPFGDPEVDNAFNLTDNKLHAALRRKVSSAYAMSNLVAYEPFVDECNKLLFARLAENARSEQRTNMQRWLQCYAYDVICMITFTQRLGFLDQGEDVNGLIHLLDVGNGIGSVLGLFPIAHKIFTGFVSLIASVASFDPNAAMKKHIARQIERHENEDTIKASDGPADFVTKMLRARRETPERMTTTDIFAASLSNMAAGSDTTSISLSGILVMLYQHPDILANLRAELDRGVKDGSVSDPITFKQAQNLPYLQAVIKEGLRVHPATGFTMPRVIPKGGLVVAGRFFPEDSVVGINAWVAHANTSFWGADAQSFRPERWLESNAAHLDQYFMTFGMGSRTCLGKNISLLEISKVVPLVVQRFDLDFAGEAPLEKPWNNWFVKPTQFFCKLRLRKAA